jgi:hypothetical protein
VTFEEVVLVCWHHPEFVHHFNRLNGTSLGKDKRLPIEKLVDQAAGYEPGIDEKEAFQFFDFVKDVVWDRLAVR